MCWLSNDFAATGIRVKYVSDLMIKHDIVLREYVLSIDVFHLHILDVIQTPFFLDLFKFKRTSLKSWMINSCMQFEIYSPMHFRISTVDSQIHFELGTGSGNSKLFSHLTKLHLFRFLTSNFSLSIYPWILIVIR